MSRPKLSKTGVLDLELALGSEDGINGFSNPEFIPYVEKTFYKNDFKLIEEKEDLKIYNRNDQTIYYYYNTSIPDDFEKSSLNFASS